MENFFYFAPVPIDFGAGKLKTLPQIIKKLNLKKGILISAPSMIRNGIADEIVKASEGRIITVFSDIQPNPTIHNTDACVQMIRDHGCEFAVAVGGGSIMDCAKAACYVANTKHDTDYFFTKKNPMTGRGIPLIAIPTTSGTASEVTAASVLTDTENGVKALMIHDSLYPVYALIDPELTLSCPPAVTAASGLDVLAHSLEAFYGKNHQPITDLAAERAASLVFEHLLTAYHEPDNLEARAKMSEASVTAGLAFNLTKTAGVHACSYPLTQDYSIPHGEACAFTLPSFWKMNSHNGPEGERLQAFSRRLGFADSDALANRIDEMKKAMGMRTTIEEVGITTETALNTLITKSFAPNMYNNPVTMTEESLKKMYLEMNEKALMQSSWIPFTS